MRSIGSFFYTLLIYVGLPLLGWGLDDIAGFFSQLPFAAYSISIMFVGLLIGYMLLQPGRMGNLSGKGEDREFVPRQRLVRLLVVCLLFGGLIFVPFADRRSIGVLNASSLLRWSGLILEILGMGLILWSGIALGRLYSPEVTLQKEHHLVTDGPYRFIRHPRYLGGIVMGIGLSLLFRSWIGLFLTMVFFVLIVFRIKDEEALLAKAFTEQWQLYCRKSWRLFPLIY